MKKVLILAMATILGIGMMLGCSNNDTTTDNSTASQTEVSQGVASDFDNTQTINILSREDGSGTRGAFIELFGIEEKAADGTKKDMTSIESDIVNKTDVMLTSVAGDPYSIGYVSLGSLNDNVKAVKIDGVEASSENIKNGTYAISRPFNIATKGDPDGVTKDFIDFIMSKEGQAIISDSYIAVDDQAAAYTGTKPEGKIIVAGSSSVTPIMEKLKEAYAAINSNAVIEVQMSDSTAGMTGAIDGICDIGMASRELKDEEKAQLTALPIALDGIAVVVNQENPLDNLTKDQVKAMFVGQLVVWTGVIS